MSEEEMRRGKGDLGMITAEVSGRGFVLIVV